MINYHFYTFKKTLDFFGGFFLKKIYRFKNINMFSRVYKMRFLECPMAHIVAGLRSVGGGNGLLS